MFKFPNPITIISAGRHLAEASNKVFKSKVVLVPGCIVYCQLATHVEHTGIYVGNGKIIELAWNGSIGNSIGSVVTVDLNTFRKSGIRDGLNIYVACSKNSNGEYIPVANRNLTKRAQSKLGSSRVYNLLTDNCHQFTVGCITGNFENNSNYLWMVKRDIKNHITNGRKVYWRPVEVNRFL